MPDLVKRFPSDTPLEILSTAENDLRYARIGELDGGLANSVYLLLQNADGGGA